MAPPRDRDRFVTLLRIRVLSENLGVDDADAHRFARKSAELQLQRYVPATRQIDISRQCPYDDLLAGRLREVTVTPGNGVPVRRSDSANGAAVSSGSVST